MYNNPKQATEVAQLHNEICDTRHRGEYTARARCMFPWLTGTVSGAGRFAAFYDDWTKSTMHESAGLVPLMSIRLYTDVASIPPKFVDGLDGTICFIMDLASGREVSREDAS